MSYTIAAVTASTIPTSGKDINVNDTNAGSVIVYNSSKVNFIVTDALGNQWFLPSQYADKYYFTAGGGVFIHIAPIFTSIGSGTGNDQLNFVILTATETTSDRRTYPFTIGPIGVGTVQSVVDDGRPVASATVESTAAGSSSSNYIQQNSGLVIISQDTTTVNREYIEVKEQQSGGRRYGIFIDMDHGLHIFEFVSGNDLLLMSGSAGNMTVPGAFSVLGSLANVGGQTTAGSFGVPVVIAAPPETTVTNGVENTIASFTTPSGRGRYRCWASFAIPASNSLDGIITVRVRWTDAALGVATTRFMVDSAALVLLASTTGTRGSQYVTTLPCPIETTGANPITVNFQDSSGGAVIADKVNAIIERMV